MSFRRLISNQKTTSLLWPTHLLLRIFKIKILESPFRRKISSTQLLRDSNWEMIFIFGNRYSPSRGKIRAHIDPTKISKKNWLLRRSTLSFNKTNKRWATKKKYKLNGYSDTSLSVLGQKMTMAEFFTRSSIRIIVKNFLGWPKKIAIA